VTFLKNAWYVAAWSDELTDSPLGQKIIGEFVALFRTSGGTAVAVADVCPHRFAPLHKGKVVGDLIECPYHGLRFDVGGKCAHNPFDPKVKPAAATVRTYPVAERDKIIWIWMGDAAQVDESTIPDYSWINDTASYTFTGFNGITQPLRYELVLDNLMDLSHGQFLHPTTLGNEAMTDGTTKDVQKERQVYSDRLNPDGDVPTLFLIGGAGAKGDKVDFWNDMRWDAPSSYFLQVGITPTGRPRCEGHYVNSAHLLTPLDEHQTIYRFVLARTFARGSDEITQGMTAIVIKAFTEEDEPMIRAVQERMAGRAFWDLNPVALKSDRAAIMVRRTLEKMIEAEVSQSS
jgi:vanillate O-demethylase monooxygenase subunit